MRTRKSSRIFGEDLTNHSPSINITLPQKHSKNPPFKKYSKDKNSIKTIQQSLSNPIIQQRIEQIMLYCCNYFQKYYGHTNYLYIQNQNHQYVQFVHQPSPDKKYIMFPTCPQLTISMRNILIQWLIQVHKIMCLRPQTLFLTIYLIDKYCSIRTINKSQYQLLALSCLFIACKYEEIVAPQLKKIIALSNNFYSSKDVLNMQSQVLFQLNFQISQPSLNWFVGAIIFSINHINSLNNQPTQTSTMQKYIKLCFYLLQLCLFQIQILKTYSPQIISNSIIYYLSMKRQFIGINTKPCINYLNSSDLTQIKQCSSWLNQIYDDRANHKYKVVNVKYRISLQNSKGDQNVYHHFCNIS